MKNVVTLMLLVGLFYSLGRANYDLGDQGRHIWQSATGRLQSAMTLLEGIMHR
jgi:hypothetical protein